MSSATSAATAFTPFISHALKRQKQRTQVLSLYRAIHKLSFTWPKIEEREYIAQEARELFGTNKSISEEDTELIDKKIMEAEARLALALHYGIPYPRAYNISPDQKTLIVPQYMHSFLPEGYEEMGEDAYEESNKSRHGQQQQYQQNQQSNEEEY